MDEKSQKRLTLWIVKNCPSTQLTFDELDKWADQNIWAWHKIDKREQSRVIDDFRNFNAIDEIQMPDRPRSFVERFKQRIRELFGFWRRR